MKRLSKALITSGEPAGIGPEIILKAARAGLDAVVIGDADVFRKRALQLNVPVEIIEYHSGASAKPGQLCVIHRSYPKPVIPGALNPDNAETVLRNLELGARLCLKREFSSLVTAPVHKAVINQAGFEFTGHTEYLAALCGVEQVVMMLACPAMKVALVTTHLALKEVPAAITREKITSVIRLLDHDLSHKFGIKRPKIYLAGLNPHAGENGYLGREEIEVLIPASRQLLEEGIDLSGPHPADTLFTPQYCELADVFVAMYHDQGLAVLKYAGFGQAANITLGLPIIRTSVDHGTALSLAGSDKACEKSLQYALTMAATMVGRNQ